ncbi:hypothetical protein RND81_05G160300 [Saponaria officinalis]|uniref:DUF6821 domain-containing protein n=1 Tax=Saponaria officinalis TaxID=3572 RepID=A0AAW1KT38_SAPOF
MDLHEWELLSDSSFSDLHQDKLVNNSTSPNSTVIDVNYYQKSSDQLKTNNLRVIPVPIKFDEETYDDQIKDQKSSSDDQEMTSKVFFKKMKENEFVDMKMDTPKSPNKGVIAQFVKKHEKDGNFDMENPITEDKLVVVEEEKKKEEDENGGVKIWKWGMTGMGAVISFGFAAAATVSFIVFCNAHKQRNVSKKQELHFQIYSHDQRFKQVVSRAKKLNEAISVMRGAPMTRAHITFGGYYESL